MATSRNRTRGNGEGAVYWDAARKKWRAQVTIDSDGNQRRRSVSAETKPEAIRKLRALQAQVDVGITPTPGRLTVGEYLDSWLETQPTTIAPNTYSQYEGLVRTQLKPRLGKRTLTALAPQDVSKMLVEMAKPTERNPNGLSANTRRLTRAVLRKALHAAQVEGLVHRNAAALATPVQVKRREGRTLTPAEFRLLLTSAASSDHAALVIVAATTGLRLGELLGLSWDDVTLDGRAEVRVRRALTRVPKVGLVIGDVKRPKSRRTVLLAPPAVAALRRHRLLMREAQIAAGGSWPAKPLGHDLVFRSPVGTPMDPRAGWEAFHTVISAVGAELDDQGKPIAGTGLGHWHPHEMRHTNASLLLAQGVDLKVVSEHLGHSSIAITADIYAHLLDDAKQQVADAITELTG